jgi:hypothetical protein
MNQFWIADGSTLLTTGFGFWDLNSLALWERDRVRADR